MPRHGARATPRTSVQRPRRSRASYTASNSCSARAYVRTLRHRCGRTRHHAMPSSIMPSSASCSINDPLHTNHTSCVVARTSHVPVCVRLWVFPYLRKRTERALPRASHRTDMVSLPRREPASVGSGACPPSPPACPSVGGPRETHANLSTTASGWAGPGARRAVSPEWGSRQQRERGPPRPSPACEWARGTSTASCRVSCSLQAPTERAS